MLRRHPRLRGTAFQKRVWEAMRKIPAGSVQTYGELARKLKTSARAVGNACRRNNLLLVVPCHRVLPKGGDSETPGGYRWGSQLKSALLGLEAGPGSRERR